MDVYAVALLAWLMIMPQQGAAPGGSPAQVPPSPPVDLGVSLDRIQEVVSRPPALETTGIRPVFRIEVFERRPTVEDILGRDYLRGPVPATGTSHQEFLDMVTPDEFRGMAMFSNGEAMTIAATSLGLKWALMKAIDKLKEARNERAKEAARREVLETMNAIEAARKKKSGG